MGCSDASPEEVLTHENAVLARVLQSSEDVVELAREHLTSRTSAPKPTFSPLKVTKKKAVELTVSFVRVAVSPRVLCVCKCGMGTRVVS